MSRAIPPVLVFALCLAAACGNRNESSSGDDASGGHASGVGGSGRGGVGAQDGSGGSPVQLDLDSTAGAAGETVGGGDICDSIQLNATSIPPRVVFVQDLSSSMQGQWQPLRTAMVSIADTYGDRLQLGMVPFSSTYLDYAEEIRTGTDDWFADFFAANDDDCTVSDSSIILPALGNAEAVVDTYDAIVEERMVGGTPTYEAMEKAGEILLDGDPGDGSSAYVILVTDGEPNCSSPSGDLIADVQDAISTLAGAGIDTYVVGYHYDGEALDDWAAAGNTTSYYDADDTTELDRAISGILTELVPCEYDLSAPVDDPRYVRVTIDGVDRAYDNEQDGWTLGADGRAVVLTGDACSDLRASGTHTIDVIVECDIVVIR